MEEGARGSLCPEFCSSASFVTQDVIYTYGQGQRRSERYWDLPEVTELINGRAGLERQPPPDPGRERASSACCVSYSRAGQVLDRGVPAQGLGALGSVQVSPAVPGTSMAVLVSLPPNPGFSVSST